MQCADEGKVVWAKVPSKWYATDTSNDTWCSIRVNRRRNEKLFFSLSRFVLSEFFARDMQFFLFYSFISLGFFPRLFSRFVFSMQLPRWPLAVPFVVRLSCFFFLWLFNVSALVSVFFGTFFWPIRLFFCCKLQAAYKHNLFGFLIHSK